MRETTPSDQSNCLFRVREIVAPKATILWRVAGEERTG